MAALYRFSRPHTMLGTFVSVISVSLLALQGSPVTVYVLQGMVTALVPALLMNICIVGMNQVYDVEIDKVWNKFCYGKPTRSMIEITSSPAFIHY